LGLKYLFWQASGEKRGRKKKIKPIKTEYIESKRILYTADGKLI
jgi:hypothetical protein